MAPDVGYLVRSGQVVVIATSFGMQFAVMGNAAEIDVRLANSSDDDFLLFELAEAEGEMTLRRSTIMFVQRAQVVGGSQPGILVPDGPLPPEMR